MIKKRMKIIFFSLMIVVLIIIAFPHMIAIYLYGFRNFIYKSNSIENSMSEGLFIKNATIRCPKKANCDYINNNYSIWVDKYVNYQPERYIIAGSKKEYPDKLLLNINSKEGSTAKKDLLMGERYQGKYIVYNSFPVSLEVDAAAKKTQKFYLFNREQAIKNRMNVEPIDSFACDW